MKINTKYQLLHDLVNTHSVTGDTGQILQFLNDYFNKRKVQYWQEGYGTLLVGNKNAKKLFAAHIDEVGFQVTKIESDGKLRILPVGWIFANRLDHTVVYLNINDTKKKGVILHEEPLKQENIKSFNSVYLDLGFNSENEARKANVKEGQTGSFQREFIENGTSIIASSLDNKVSVWTLLELISNKPSVLKNNLFAFTTDEEMQDHSANGLCFKYQPDLAVVLDYCPIHQTGGKAEVFGITGKGTMIMYRGGQYILHPQVREYFETKITKPFQKGFISEETLPSLEPNNFENNGHTRAVNVCVPAFGYHGSAYSLRKIDLENFYKMAEEISTTKF